MAEPKPYLINGVAGHRWTCESNEEWRVERSKSIGASSIYTIMGLNPYQTPMELAEKMKAELNGVFDYTQTEAMEDGHDFEPVIAAKFARRAKMEIIKASSAEFLMRRDDLPFMHCSPDRTAWLPGCAKNDDNKGIVECKFTDRLIDPEDPPLSWQFQLQMQMGISGYRRGWLTWYCFAKDRSKRFGYAEYDFIPEVFADITEVCRQFWDECIIGDRIPDPVNVRDVVSRWPESVDGKVRTVTDDVVATYRRLKDKLVNADALNDEIEELKDQLKLAVEDDEAIRDPMGNLLATYKSAAGRTTIDSKKLKEKFPQAYAECSKVGNASRTFRLK